MRIIIRNQADIAKKHLRWARRKLVAFNSKFGDLIYSKIYIKQVASNPESYRATAIIGVPGPDIVVTAVSQDLTKLWSDLFSKMKIRLSNHASKRKRQ